MWTFFCMPNFLGPRCRIINIANINTISNCASSFRYWHDCYSTTHNPEQGRGQVAPKKKKNQILGGVKWLNFRSRSRIGDRWTGHKMYAAPNYKLLCHRLLSLYNLNRLPREAYIFRKLYVRVYLSLGRSNGGHKRVLQAIFTFLRQRSRRTARGKQPV